MSNRTYVCLECKTARRAVAAYALTHSLRCPSCSKSMIQLPWKRRIPSKSSDDEWEELRMYLVRLDVGLIPTKAITKAKKSGRKN